MPVARVPIRIGRAALAGAARLQGEVVYVVVLAVEVAVAGPQEGGDDPQRLLEAADRVVEWEAERAVLEGDIAGPEPEDQPPVADGIEGRGHLGDEGGIAEVGAGDQRAELHVRHRHRQGGQEGPGLPGSGGRLLRDAGWHRAPGGDPEFRALDVQVIGEPEGVEADLGGQLGHAEDLVPRIGVRQV